MSDTAAKELIEQIDSVVRDLIKFGVIPKFIYASPEVMKTLRANPVKPSVYSYSPLIRIVETSAVATFIVSDEEMQL